MAGVLYDSNGNVIISPNTPVDPEQMIYDSSGKIINPATEDGNILDIENVLAGQLDAKLSTRSSETTLATINGKFVSTASGLKVDGSSVTQPVSITGSVLPTGAATEATLSALSAKVTTVNTGDVTVASSALPTGAAKDLTLTDGTQKARTLDGSGAAISSTGGALDVNIKSGTTVDVAVSQTSDSILAYGFDGALNQKIKTNVFGQIESAVVSSALPAGASTEATLAAMNAKIPASPATEGGNLALIKAKTDNLDTTLSSRATEATLSTLNSKITDTGNGIKVNGSAVTQPISAASLPLPTGAATDATLTGGSARTRTLDGSGTAITSTAGALDVNIKSGTTVDVAVNQASDSILAYGFDGAANQKIKTNASGQIEGVVVSSALPTGAATNAVITGGTAKTQIVDGLGTVVAADTSTGANAMNVFVRNWERVDTFLSPDTDGVKVYGFDGLNNKELKTDEDGELQVDVLSLPLPPDAATQTTLAALNAKIPADPAREGGNLLDVKNSVASIDTKVSDVATQTTLAALNAKVTTTVNGLQVDNSGVTQPISAVALPLPNGAATSQKQSDGSAKTQIVDGVGNVVGSTGNAVDVNIKSSAIQIQTSVVESEDSILVYGNDGAANRAIKTDAAGQAEVVVTASALPTGAATEVTLAAIDTKMPADPAREGGNLLAIKTNTDNLAGAMSSIATEATLAALSTKVVSTGPGLGIKVDGSSVTHPVSVASLPLPTGAATSVNQVTGNNYLQAINNSVATEVTLSTINDKVVNAGAGVVVAPGTNTFPISAANLPLPAGAARDITLTNGTMLTKVSDSAGAALTSTDGALDVNLKSPIQVNVSLAQAEDSVAVFGSDGVTNRALATNTLGQLSVNVLASGLPTGASTSANQATGNASLASIDGKMASLGQKNMATSMPVAIATDQSTLPISAASLPLPTGASTSANQTTGNASLASIDGKMASLGQKNMATSMPVVVASDQTPVQVVDNFSSYDNVNFTTASLAALATTTNDFIVPNGETWHILGLSFARKLIAGARQQPSTLSVTWDPTGTNKRIGIGTSSGDSVSSKICYTVVGNGVKVLRVVTTNGSQDAAVHDVLINYRKA